MIKVGAATETAMKEKKARVEDALNATRAAVEEGIVPGGGVALLRASKAIDRVKAEGDEKVGAMIVKRACEEPIRQIVENAGLEGSVIVEKVKSETVPNRGYDAETMEYVDMVQAGIIDPTKVERVALQNAASIASLLADHRGADHGHSGGEAGSGAADAARRHVLELLGGGLRPPSDGRERAMRPAPRPASPRSIAAAKPPLEPVSLCRR